MDRIILSIEGMSCAHCVKSVSDALQNVDGVIDVRVDLAGRCAEVTVDGGVSREELAQAVELQGFDVVD